MEKLVFFLACYFFTTLSLSQNYSIADSIVKKYPDNLNTISKLVKKINSDFNNDFEKTRAIYTWIASNVEYDPKEYGKFNFSYSSKTDSIKKNKKYLKQLSSRVIKKKKAVCEGYSVLFLELCNELNINSKIITGDSKTEIKDIGKRFNSNHAWNIVNINNNNYLIDVTWGAGSYDNKFNKDLNYFYFFTNPILFIKNHYPDNYKNSLLKEQISKETFLTSPLVLNHKYELISPSMGILNKNEINSTKFIFSSTEEINKVSFKIGNKYFEVTDFKKEKNQISFTGDILSNYKGKELIVYLNFKPVVGYKLK